VKYLSVEESIYLRDDNSRRNLNAQLLIWTTPVKLLGCFQIENISTNLTIMMIAVVLLLYYRYVY